MNENFNKWEQETTQFLKDTMGIPKPPVSPLVIKNQKIQELIQYVAESTELDKNKILVDLTSILIL